MIYLVLGFLLWWGFSIDLKIGLVVLAITLGFIVYKALPMFFAIMGNKAYNEDNIEKTVKNYNKALSFRHAKVSYGITYILILMRLGKMDEALKIANNLTMHPKATPGEKFMIKEYRCLIYFKQGNKQEALDDAKDIFEQYKNTTIYGLLGYLMLACDQPLEETLTLCLEAYDYNADDRDIVDNLLLAYYKTGDLNKAEELAKDLMEMSPTFVEAHYHSALVSLALGKKDEAKEFLDSMDECIRTALTTVSEEEIEALKKQL